jgi:LPXTG-motif cell wall-anchored protein
MRTFLLAGLLCLIALPASVATAQDHLLIVDAPELPQTGQTRNEAAVVGAGIMAGAAVGYLLPFRAAALVGGVTGGIVSHWWYTRAADDYELLLRRNEH